MGMGGGDVKENFVFFPPFERISPEELVKLSWRERLKQLRGGTLFLFLTGSFFTLFIRIVLIAKHKIYWPIADVLLSATIILYCVITLIALLSTKDSKYAERMSNHWLILFGILQLSMAFAVLGQLVFIGGTNPL